MIERKLVNDYPFITYSIEKKAIEEVRENTEAFYTLMDQRRTVREFSTEAVPKEIIENIILTASTAPSGAHKQPWTFCIVSDKRIKQQIREAAEAEEYKSYHGRMPASWLEDLKPFQTDWKKPFLEDAPYLIIVFRKSYDVADGIHKNTYYSNESCGIATGFLLAAIHQAGLVALSHTPSPMNFLSRILGRPENEKPFLLIPVGFPLEKTWVPDIKRKHMNEISVWY
jgi:iodotyrosine deiodinase